MNCDRVLPLISRLLDNEVSFDERELIDGHVHECEPCFALFLKLKEDSARLDEAFAGLKGARENFTNSTAALIAERERPHATAPSSPSRTEDRSLLHRFWLPAAVSAAASAAAFIGMSAVTHKEESGTERKGSGPIQTAHVPKTRIDEIDLVVNDANSKRPANESDRDDERGGAPAPAHRDPAASEKDPNSATADSKDVDGEINAKIDQLITAVLSSDPAADAIRGEILSLGTLSQRVVDALMARFDSEDDILVKETLLRVLAGIHSPDGSLGEFLALRFHRDETVPIKRLLVEGLLANPYPGAVELFETILRQEGEDNRVKVLAVQALGGIGTAEAMSVLTSIALRDENDSVRLATVRVLSTFSDPALIEEFLALIRSQTETFDVQEEALEAVTSSAPDRDSAREFLEQAIHMTPRPEIKARAQKIIQRLMGDRQEVK